MLVRVLQDYLDRIETAMVAGEAILARRDPADAQRIKAGCTDAASLIGTYHLFVHREIFEPLMARAEASRDDALRREVCLLKAECISLTEDLRTGVKTMAALDEPLDHDAVRARVEWFNGRVRRHIASITQLLATPDAALRRAA